MAKGDPTELFRFTSNALPDEQFHVVRFRGTEGLNRLFSFTIDMVSKNNAVDGAKLLSRNAVFAIHRENAPDAIFCGFPSSFRQGGFFNGYTYYTVELRPAFFKLSQIVQSAIFLNKTVKDVAEELLGGQQFFSLPHEFRFTRTDYPSPEFTMQYGESICEYILWRMEEQGAYFYFAADGDKVIFADSPESHDSAKIKILYSPASGLEGDHREEVVTSFTLHQTVLPKRVVVRSYDWKNPSRPVVGMADVSDDGMGDVYLTNEMAESDAEASRLAKIRAQELVCHSRLFSGVSAVPNLRPGLTFTLSDHYAPSFNRDYLVTEVEHEGSQEAFISLGLGLSLHGVEDHLFYRNAFTAIPADCTYRPKRTARRAKISGVLRAFVDGGGSGARAELDEFGRYKLLFPFDVSGRSKGNASCWVRMSQPQVGQNNGMSFPLLPGAEVTVAFVDGNPDCPVITGSLPNGETGALTGQGNANLQGIKTPGGNQITFNDSDTHQGISLQTPSGLGMTMSAGSLGATTTHNDTSIEMSSVMGTELANVAKTLVTGCKVQSVATMDVYATVIAAVTAIQGGISGIFDSLSKKAAKEKKKDEEEASKWCSDIAKTIGLTIINLATTIKTWKAPSNFYGVSLIGSKGKSAQTLQVWPGWSKTLALILTWISGRVTQFVAEGTDSVKDAANAKSNAEEKMDTHLKEAAGKGDIKDDEERKKVYKETTNDLTKKISEAMGKGDAGKAQKLQKQLDDLRKDYDVLYNDKSDTYYKYAKNDAIRKAIVSSAKDILPELTAIILQFKALGGQKKDHGGIGLSSPDGNINLNAMNTISQHSQKGIFLNTKSEFEDAGTWGIEDEDYTDKVKIKGWKFPDSSSVKSDDKKFIAFQTDIEHHDCDILLEKTGKAHHQSNWHIFSTNDNKVIFNMFNNTFSVECSDKDGWIALKCASGNKKTEFVMNDGTITLSRGSDTKLSLLNDDTFVVKVADSSLQLSKNGEFGIVSSKGGTLDIADNIVIAPNKKTRIGNIEINAANINGPTLNLNSALKVMGGKPSTLLSKIKMAAKRSNSFIKTFENKINSLEKSEQNKANADINKQELRSKSQSTKQKTGNLLLKGKLKIG